MLTQQEQEFVNEWPQRRLTYKKGLRKYLLGLPLAITIVLALLVNIFVGWYSRAEAVLRSNSSVFIVVLIAAAGIIVFMGEFASRYKFDQYEQRYQELKAKQSSANN